MARTVRSSSSILERAFDGQMAKNSSIDRSSLCSVSQMDESEGDVLSEEAIDGGGGGGGGGKDKDEDDDSCEDGRTRVLYWLSNCMTVSFHCTLRQFPLGMKLTFFKSSIKLSVIWVCETGDFANCFSRLAFDSRN